MSRTRDEDYGVGSCSPGGDVLAPRKRRSRTHYRANEHRERTSCEKLVGKVKWSDDPRDVDCERCKHAEMW